MNTVAFDSTLNPVIDAASNDELDVLHALLKAKLSETLSIQDAYKRHYPDHQKYADLIAKEIRDFGGNSLANVVRGEGPAYHDIVCDVAKAIKAPFNKALPIDEIEASILATILSKAFEKMSEDEKMAVLDQVGKPNRSALAGGSIMVFQAIFKAGGFASYQLMLIVVNGVVRKVIELGLLKQGLPLVANAALSRVMNVATGPVGWALTSLLTLHQIAGPSYRVTIPSVVYIAMLRKSQSVVRCHGCDAVVDDTFAFCPECGAEVSKS